MDEAIKIGCDPRIKVVSQYFRMPGGARDNGKRQAVVYLDRRVIGSNTVFNLKAKATISKGTDK
jgi:hypothetical protein